MPEDGDREWRLQAWSTAEATRRINALARGGYAITLTNHALDKMRSRDLLIGDINFVLRNGFVHREAQSSTQPGLWKYRIESRTPNSENRIVGVLAIPSEADRQIKIITVMWIDE